MLFTLTIITLISSTVFLLFYITRYYILRPTGITPPDSTSNASAAGAVGAASSSSASTTTDESPLICTTTTTTTSAGSKLKKSAATSTGTNSINNAKNSTTTSSSSATFKTPKTKYLPEEIFASFLSTIKIFQYIDRNVLLEFAKNSQQMKLFAGELLTTEKHSLVLVMDGCLQIYLSSTPATANTTSSNLPSQQNNAKDDILSNSSVSSLSSDSDNVHLLNEVYEGGTASSLFDIVSIYTKEYSSASSYTSPKYHTSSSSSNHPLNPNTSPSLHTSNVFARAATETTLLIIPESTFIRISQFYPNVAAQLVQIILTRFQRVTFTTLHKYLGLTHELLKIERALNEHDYLTVNLLDPQELERLKEICKDSSSTTSPMESSLNLQSTTANNSSSESLHENKLKKYSSLAHSHQDIVERSSSDELSDYPSSQTESIHDASTPTIEAKKRYASDSGTNMRFSFLNTSTTGQSAKSEYQPTSVFSAPFNAMNSLPDRPLLSTKDVKDFIFYSIAAIIGYNPASVLKAQLRNPVFNSVLASKSERSSPKHSPSTSRVSMAPFIVDVASELQIVKYLPGENLVKYGDRNYGLIYVIHGTLDVFAIVRGNESRVFSIEAGGTVGYFSSIIGNPSFVSVRASSETYVGIISKSNMDYIAERCPSILFTLARRLGEKISPLVRNIDLALEWNQVDAGKLLYQQDEPKSDFIYIVLNGRLRAIEDEDHRRIVGEYGQSESVGELEVLTRVPRVSTVYAIRDTELACMPQTLFHSLALKYPEITIHISRLLASRGQKEQAPNLNLRTIALLPAHSDVPILDFAERIKDSVYSIGESATILDSSSVTGVLGRHAFSKMGTLKLLSWLAEQEEKTRLVFYTADTGPSSAWTLRCIRQADCVLIIGLAEMDPDVGEYEKTLLKLTETSARKELVLLHPNHSIEQGNTRLWLSLRPWIDRHHHVQIPLLVTRTITSSVYKHKNTFEDLKSKIEKLTQFYVRPNSNFQGTPLPKQQSSKNDFARLARRLTGKSIGLALGGGGARGIAHLGIIRAFTEAGVPIDLIGGVSIGALIGGLFSMNEDVWYVYWRAKEFSNRTGSIWRQLLDLTYPLASWFTGHEFNRVVWKCFGNAQMEDCWLNYVCLTTNITHSRLETHSFGTMWRYVRASMSLSGYLPPLCENGDMLVDGGYLNNLPGDIIRLRGGDTVIAIDVSSDDIARKATYGDALSGVYALLSQFNPFAKDYIPTLAEIQSRLAYVSCVKQLEELKIMDGCIYLRPPIGKFGTMDFGKFDEIFEAGYQYGLKVVRGWEEDGTLSKWHNVTKKKKSKTRRNSI